MSLSSFFQRFRRAGSSGQASATDAVSSATSDVEAARVRARRRLIGMAVLVGAGLIGFPWLFETQPRPMSQDVQVVQAPGAGAQTPSVPAGMVNRGASGRVAVAGIVAPAEPADVKEAPVTREEPARSEPVQEEPRRAEPEAKPEPKSEPRTEPKTEAKREPKVAVAKLVDKAPSKPTPKPAKDTAKDSSKEPSKDAAKSASKPADKTGDKAATRYVVQFGAFADVNAAHEARMKVERLGGKTYAQQVDTPAGKRIRVRLGPFADKAEADKAMATVRKAGLTGALLTL
jgi:DedD protein